MAPESYRYVVPVEANAHASDQVSLTGTAEGQVPHGGNSPLTRNDNIFRGDSSPIDPSDWRSTARTRAGAPVPHDQINDETVVEIGGVRDTVAAFRITGQLPYGDLSKAPQVAPQDPQAAPEDAPKDDRPPVPAEAKAQWEATEQVVAPLLEQGGATAYAVAESLISGGDPADLLQQLSLSTHIESAELQATVTAAFDQYQDIARKSVGMSPAEWQQFSSFCDSVPQERAEASRHFFHEGDLNGIRGLVAKFREAQQFHESQGEGASAAGANDANVYRAVTAMGIKAHREQNGTTILHLPQGKMPWREALKRGLIEFA